MSGILLPEKSSRENIIQFIETVENIEIRQLLIDNLDHIMSVGADQNNSKNHRNIFFQAIEQLISEKIGLDYEN